jgi:hypothetical protein
MTQCFRIRQKGTAENPVAAMILTIPENSAHLPPSPGIDTTPKIRISLF